MSSYSHARTASDIQTSVLLGLPEQSLNPPPSPSLDSHGFSLIQGDAPEQPPREVWERKLGSNEVSYYLPSRAEGVNDMYLHLRLFCPAAILSPSRVLLVWALLRLRHPLLASVVDVRALNDIFFVYELPRTTQEAILSAKNAATFTEGKTKEELVDAFLNGPRTLSKDLLSKILISRPPPVAAGQKAPEIYPNPSSPFNAQNPENEHFEFMFFSGHFLGDGVSFAVIANEFLTLLASDMAEEDLSVLVQSEIDARVTVGANPIPVSTERRLAIPRSFTRFQKGVSQVEFMNNQARQIGGQTFPREKLAAERNTFVDTRVFDPATTKAILTKCKMKGVTIAHAVFALVNIAWARRKQAENYLPLMMYSAINLRGALRPPKPAASSFFHLCVGYYNVVLPSFLISTLTDEQTFWLRCQSTKRQTHAAVKSKFLVTRAMAMSMFREQQAIGWAKIDDAAAAAAAAAAEKKNEDKTVVEKLSEGIEQLKVKAEEVVKPVVAAATSTPVVGQSPAGTGPTEVKKEMGLPKAPQAALMGLSFLGNLDAISNYTTYPQVHTSDLTFGARQRPGGMLMFSYTFAGRLWFSLGWDVNSYPEGYVQKFWQEVIDTVPEFLVNP